MHRFAIPCVFVVLFGGWLASTLVASAEDRAAEKILKELSEIKPPAFDSSQREDRTAVQAYVAERQKVMDRRAELIGELYRVSPDHEQILKLLPERWIAILNTGTAGAKALLAELDQVQATSSKLPLKAEAAYWKAVVSINLLRTSDLDQDATVAAINGYRILAPLDERGASMLAKVAQLSPDLDKQVTLYRQVIKDYPDSTVAQAVEASLKRLEGVGKPFELEFTDAIKGSKVSTKDLKGKIVVIDFWATWCTLCLAEMPTMKRLYAEYHDKGVEFIGISLDQPVENGGLKDLTEYVAKSEIPWPQYYQGKFWDSEFSNSWYINTLPAVFIVDADGKVADVNAQGKLEKLIPEYLKKIKKGEAAAGGN
jgi:thiol-disulfide isomerase/thioredoxin